MKSGMLAAEAVYDAVVAESPSSPVEVTAYVPRTPNINTGFRAVVRTVLCCTQRLIQIRGCDQGQLGVR